MLSKRVKIIINAVTIIALIVLIYFSWPQITEGLKEIGGAKWSIIALMIPLQVFNFFAVGMIYYSYFTSHRHSRVTKKNMFKVALELNFVNHVFPSGGVAGFTYLGYRMKHYGVAVSRTTLAQSLRFALTFISFLILLFFGLFMLSFGDRSSGVTLYIGLSIAFLTLFGTMLAVFIISDEGRIKAFTAFLPRLVNAVLKPFKKKRGNAIDLEKIEKLFGDLHTDYEELMKDRKKLKKPFMWALLVNISEVLTIYLAYLALGQVVNPGAVILAYSVASFAGLVSILPGGIGVYEALMTTTLAASGVPKALALSATLIYRIFTMIIFVPTGFILYQLALRKGETEHISRDATVSTDTN
ncbi:MAG TPA: lysylphosphatidylglycerol synthase transmembrane domain-containing protein [Candidatus Saccharibacteria bacterium]|nr:flippase-like domain-containing protein [Candidatus Nomurabacteria bacterium]HPR10467.1 lysylphosphatidylglycerol synthase transmembrane domain-containing protein [Candidatus Saccharibacteria bacterium]